MSIIPSISNKLSSYTVLGGHKQADEGKCDISILLLNRGGRFHREELLADISGLVNADIMYMEGPGLSFDTEPLSRKHPAVRFLLLKEEVSTGEMINLGFQEARGDFVFVMWSDMKLFPTHLSSRFIEKLNQDDILCTVPLLKNHNREIIPSLQVPALIKKRLKVIPWSSTVKGTKSLFPFDFCGIYNRKRFFDIKGYDPLILNPYWQKLDFGFRANLWGEEILYNSDFAIICDGDKDIEDSTPDQGYKRFYLRNISVKYKKGAGILTLFGLLTYMFKSDTGPFHAVKEYLEARKWVFENRDRFVKDYKNLVKSWEPPEV